MNNLLHCNQQESSNCYYREFDHDLPGIKSNDFSIKRLVLVALPYMSLYQPASFLLSATMGSCRVVANLSKYWVGELSFLETALSVGALASTIFAHPLGLVVSTAHDIVIEGSDLAREIRFGQYKQAIGSFIQLANSITYLGLMTAGGPQLLAYSLVLQVLNSLYKAREEYAKKRYLEAAGHLGMAAARGYQMLSVLSALGICLEKIRIDELLYYLRMPFDKTMESAIRLTLPHTPSKESKTCSLLDRVRFVATTALLIPAIPLSLGLFGLASIIDAVRWKFNLNHFEYLEGAGKEKTGTPRVFITWNVCALFGGLPIPFGGVAPVEERMQDIAQNILDTQADLVCLQEVSPPAAQLLYRELKGEYRHFYTRIDPDPLLTLDSGLFVASKMPLTNPTVTPLTRLGMLHRALFSFEIGEDTFGVTHLEAGLGEASFAIREQQLVEILKKSPRFLLGDMNEKLSSGSLLPIYHNLNDPEMITATDRFIGTPIDFSIDYVLSKSVDKIKVVLEKAYDDLGKWAISDHHILIATR